MHASNHSSRTSGRRPRARSALDLDGLHRILSAPVEQRCVVSPSPDLSEKIKEEAERLNGLKRVRDVGAGATLRGPRHPGFNDGLIIPGSYFPLGTSIDAVRSAASDRSPLHGTLNVAVVLIDFDDQPMTESTQHFDDLFFSEGVLPDGSVREYYTEVTNGLVELTGQVLGPYRMPEDLSHYANGDSGIGSAFPNSRTMAQDAAGAADPDINFGPYDNDSNGFVDAFVVVHAGGGAEETGSLGDIWSHKWVLPSEYSSDGTKIFAYLTVPEDARIGVCAHELGHLLFGFPDLYDIDNSSEGIGNWCLMAGGSWGGGGDTPTHPSAWCKSQQAWVTVQNVTTNGTLSIADVKDAHTVYRLWKDGAGSQEYFLVENRQQNRMDVSLPDGGLLIWHIDDAIANNSDESHYKVGLEQADGALHMENNTNRGDPGDPFPGSTANRNFTNTSTPNSKSYGGMNTCVSVTAISDPAAVMTANVQVQCGKNALKDFKDLKDGRKEHKEWWKERSKDRKEVLKDGLKDGKEFVKEPKEIFEDKPFLDDKRPEKPQIDKAQGYDKDPLGEGKFGEGKFTDGKLVDGKPVDGPGPSGQQVGHTGRLDHVEHRLSVLEQLVNAGSGAPTSPVGQPFVRRELRPDLRQSALLNEPEGNNPSGPIDKRSYDSPPQR